MGGDVALNTHKPHGIFYLETTEIAPFVIPNHEAFKRINIISADENAEEKQKNIKKAPMNSPHWFYL